MSNNQLSSNRKTRFVSLAETFKLDLQRDLQITAFEDRTEFVPAVDPSYVFPVEETVMFLMGLETNNTIYITGHSGTGKTELVRQVAARLNYNLVTLNFDGHLTRADLVGETEFVNNQTQFRYGALPTAFRSPGTIILLDEIDACPPETAFVLQRALSEDRTLFLLENSESVPLHPQNRIVGTANTSGFGDPTGLYLAGTTVQNYSFMARWQMVLKLRYPSKEVERFILQKRFPEVDGKVLSAVCDVMTKVRDGYEHSTLTFPLTVRDSINWVSKIALLDLPMKAAKVSFLNKMPVEDARTVAEVIQRTFVLPVEDDQRFVD